MYDDEIRSFVEAVEPDFSYEGTDGAMAMVVESTHNLIALEEGIEYGELSVQQENVIGDAFDAIWKRIKQFFNWILELIKKVLAKVKAFFMMLRRKLTMAAAKAFKTIGEFVKNHTNAKKMENEKIEYNGLNAANVAKLIANIPDVPKGVKITPAIVEQILNSIPKDSIPAEAKATAKAAFKTASDNSNNQAISDVMDIVKQNIGSDDIRQLVYERFFPGLDGKNFISELKEKLIEKKTIAPSEKSFKEIYSNDLLKNLDKAYDGVMKLHSWDLKNVNEIQKVVEKKTKELLGIKKEGQKNIKAGINKTLSVLFKYISSGLTIIHSAVATVGQAIASTLMSVYKSALGATLKGLKRRAAYAVKSHDESVDITIV